MTLKNSVFIVCLSILSGCENQPDPFDISKIDCKNADSIESITNAEHKAKAVAHCAKLKSRESRFKPSDDTAWSVK